MVALSVRPPSRPAALERRLRSPIAAPPAPLPPLSPNPRTVQLAFALNSPPKRSFKRTRNTAQVKPKIRQRRNRLFSACFFLTGNRFDTDNDIYPPDRAHRPIPIC